MRVVLHVGLGRQAAAARHGGGPFRRKTRAQFISAGRLQDLAGLPGAVTFPPHRESVSGSALPQPHAFDTTAFAGPGARPAAAVIPDGGGNLYGTTSGLNGFGGTVFKPDAASGYALPTLHTFVGGQPLAAVLADASGNLY